VTPCASCRRPIAGTHADVLVCAESWADDTVTIYCLPCATREVPWGFANVFSIPKTKRVPTGT
jgi:hypothetical protein